MVGWAARIMSFEAVVKPERITVEEINRELQEATGRFFHDKFQRLDELSPAKRRFLLAVLKLLVEHSYLADHIRSMAHGGGEAPEAMRKVMSEAGIEMPQALG